MRLLLPGEKHSFKKSDHNVQRDVMVDSAFFEEVCKFLFASPQSLKNIVYGKLVCMSIQEITEIERLLNDFSQETNIHKKRCMSLELVCKLLSKFCSTSNKSSNYSASYPDVIKNILTSLTKPEHLGKTINDMVTHLGYSPIYISRLFKKHVGITFSEYLKDIRISNTAYYLENTNYSLQQICNLVGLDNLSYLNKIFKQKYGTTPIKYRKMAHKELYNPLYSTQPAQKATLQPLKDSKNDQHATHITQE
jgi:YesN/AraC family two-component response regulator